jgi:hypothetical protein
MRIDRVAGISESMMSMANLLEHFFWGEQNVIREFAAAAAIAIGIISKAKEELDRRQANSQWPIFLSSELKKQWKCLDDIEQHILDLHELPEHHYSTVVLPVLLAVFCLKGSPSNLTNNVPFIFKLKQLKEFDETWFNVDPKHSIFTHLSEIPYQNFLSQNISLVEFERLPYVNPNFFSFGWINAEELLAQVKTKKAFNLPEIHALNTSFQILNAPKTKQLKIKEKVRFELSFQEDLHFHLVNSLDEWIPFEKTENGSSINFIPFDAGEIKIMLELKDGAIPILTYDTK